MDLLDQALQFARADYSVVPTQPDGSKRPAAYWKTYQDHAATPQQVTAWLTAGGHDGIGLVCGAVSGNLEMLELEGRAVTEGHVTQLAQLLADNGLADVWARLNTGYLELTPSGGLHWLYRVAGTPARNLKLARRPATPAELADNPADRVKVLAETRGEGGYVVVAPSNGRTHDTGKAWTLLAGGVATVPTLTEDERDHLHAVVAMLDQMPAPEPQRAPAGPAGDATGDRPGDDYNASATWQDILAPHGWTLATRIGGGHGWRRPGKDRGISATTGTRPGDRLYVFSSSTPFDTEVPYSKFGALAVLEHGGDHAATARALRRQGYGTAVEPARRIDPADLIAPTPSSAPAPRPQQAAEPPKTAVAEPPPAELHRSHVRIAERLTITHADTLRYAHGLGWLTWDGTRWRRDRDGAPTRAAIATLKQAIAHADADLAKDIRKAETASSLTGILTIATCLHPLSVAAETLDPDPHLLNTPTGTLDLRTGQLRPHDRTDHITKVTGCGYDPGARSAAYDTFLAQVLPSADVRGYVQRLIGQALVGRVTEHVLPILTGVGCNGKTTLVELVIAAFGEYAIAADPQLLVAQSHYQHPTGQADLLGARLAVTQETDEGRHLASATVKRLTGGDKIRARRMRQDFFEFEPSHTAVMVTNHKPKMSGDDPALWRRIQVVPFDVVIANPDTTLPERLRLELPAVLAWAVRGYEEYKLRGLDPPPEVTERTREYQVSSDALGRFLDECTIAADPSRTNYTARSREVFSAWSDWCHTNGEPAGSEVDMATALARRGFQKVKRVGVMTYFGLALASNDSAGDERDA